MMIFHTKTGFLRAASIMVFGVIAFAFLVPLQAQDRFPPPGQGQGPRSVPNQQPRQSGFPSQQRQPQAQRQPQFQQQPQFRQQQPGGQPVRSAGSRQQGQPGFSPQVQEMQDFGVPPISQLHTGPMHGPTPTSIPGGRLTTTAELSAALRQNNSGWLVFHVLGGQEYLPNAQYAAPASAAGSFNDQTQQKFTQYLGQVTQGRKNTPLVFYCASPQCWMSYNASLPAINGGFTNVLWYRGGIAAWKAAGLPIAPPAQSAGRTQ